MAIGLWSMTSVVIFLVIGRRWKIWRRRWKIWRRRVPDIVQNKRHVANYAKHLRLHRRIRPPKAQFRHFKHIQKGTIHTVVIDTDCRGRDDTYAIVFREDVDEIWIQHLFFGVARKKKRKIDTTRIRRVFCQVYVFIHCCFKVREWQRPRLKYMFLF